MVFLLTHGQDSLERCERVLKKKKKGSSRANLLSFPFSYVEVAHLGKRIADTNTWAQLHYNKIQYAETQRRLGAKKDLDISSKESRLKLSKERKRDNKQHEEYIAKKKSDSGKRQAGIRKAKRNLKDDSQVDRTAFTMSFEAMEKQSLVRAKNARARLERAANHSVVHPRVEVEEKKDYSPPPVASNRVIKKTNLVATIPKVIGNVVAKEYRNNEPVRASGYTKSETRQFREEKKLSKLAYRERRRLAKEAKGNPIRTESGYEETCPIVECDNSIADTIRDMFLNMSCDMEFSGFAKLCTFFYQLYRGRNFLDYTAAIYAYGNTTIDSFVHFSSDVLKKFVTDHVDLLLNWSSNKVETEAGITDVSNFFSSVVSSQLFTTVKTFVISVASTQWFGRDFTQNVFRTLGDQKNSFLNLAMTIISSLKNLAIMGNAWSNGMSFTEAFLSGDPAQTIINEAHALLPYRDCLYSGLPVEGWRDRADFTIDVKRIQDMIKVHHPNMHPSNCLYKDFMKVKVDIDLTYASLQNFCMTSRPAPIGMLVIGIPHIGKSHILAFICTIWSKVKGRAFRFEHMYTRVYGSDYWDGYNPASHEIIKFSEIGRTKSSIAVSTGDLQLGELLPLIDTQPYSVNMAFDKSGTFARPGLVIGDSNNPSLNIDVLYHCSEAYYRRLYITEVVVLPDFRKDGSLELDVRKSLNAGGNLMDRYKWSIYKITNKVVGKKEYFLQDATLDEYVAYTTKLFTEHLESTTASSLSMEKMEDYLKSDDRLDEKNYSPPATEAGVSLGFNSLTSKIKSGFREKFNAYKYCAGVCINNLCVFIAIRTILMLMPTSVAGELIVMSPLRLFLCFLWCLFYHAKSGFVIFLLGLLSICLNYVKILSATVRVGLERKKAEFESVASIRYKTLRYIIGCGGSNPHMPSNSRIDLFCKLSLLMGGLVIAYKMKNASFMKRLFGSSVNSENGAYEIICNTEKEKYGIGATMQREKHSNHAVWNVRRSVSKPLHTGSMSELYAGLRTRIRHISFRSNGKDTHFYGLGVAENCFVTNMHNLHGEISGVLRVSLTDGIHVNGSGYTDVSFDKTNTILVCEDVVLVRASGLRFSSIIEHFPDTYEDLSSTGIVAGEIVDVVPSGSVTAVDRFVGEVCVSRSLSYDLKHHAGGMCGLPIVKSSGKGSYIVGLHFAGSDGSPHSYGVPILKQEIVDAMENCLGVFPIMSEVGYDDIKFEEPSHKSLIHYEILHNIDYYGKLPGPIILDTKSRLERTRIDYDIAEYFKENHGEPISQFGKPMMKPTTVGGIYYSPYNKAVTSMCSPRASLKPLILNRVVDLLTKRFCEGIKDIDSLSPLTMSDAINGVSGDAFIRRINASTSGGFGFPGIKADYMPLVSEDGTRIGGELLSSRVQACLARYEEGKSCRFTYVGKLKDEARSVDKCLNGSTRMFFMSPLDALVIARMFLTSFYTLMIERNVLFCTAVGIDMHRGAHDLYSRLAAFSENIIEGDYGAYDQSMPFGVGDATSRIIWNVLKEKGYNNTALNIVKGILTDNLFPSVEILKDMFEVPALQPSGKFATAEDNSLKGLVLLLYAWLDMGLDETVGDFFEFILPVTYGDDVIAASRTPFFNSRIYADYVRDVLLMKFTSSSKGHVDYEFLRLDQMSFLKRTFVRSCAFGGRYMAPLSLSSISRALTWYLPSNHMTEDQQVVSCVMSMLWEYAIFCPSKYHLFRSFLMTLLSERYGKNSKALNEAMPTFEYIEKSIVGEDSSAGMLPDLQDKKSENIFLDDDHFGPVRFFTECNSNPLTLTTKLTRIADKNQTRLLLAKYEEELAYMRLAVEDNKDLLQYFNVENDFRSESHKREIGPPLEHLGFINRFEDVNETVKRLRRLVYPNERFFTESGMMHSGVIDPNAMDKKENFIEVAGEDFDNSNAGNSYYPETGQQTDLQLQDFFERPVEIEAFSMPLSTYLSRSYEIWDLYTRNPSVRSKLRNYAYFSATLHVRITISGSPNHCGKLLVSYQPFASSNLNLATYANSLGLFPNMRNLLNNYLSQSDGARTIDVRSNLPLEITIPYININPMCRLFNTDVVVAAGTGFSDLVPMGKLYVTTLVPVTSTTAAPSSVDVQVLCWATDVKLGCPTGTQIAITTESGTDEFEQGPIERVTSRLAEASSKFASIPSISPYAVASQMFFSALSGAAAVFGWSKPVVVDEPMKVRQIVMTNGCQGIGYDTSMRLTLDPKQELLVDPRIVAVTDDEMTIRSISSRMSHFTTFTWADTNGTLVPIWYCRVSPRIDTHDVGALRTFKQPTAMSFASMPFAVWNGTIKYRFEIVCSAFHRGKIGVMFEPNLVQSALINANISTNKQHMLVVDIQETQTFEICVNWAQPRQWASVNPTGLIEYGTTLRVTEPDTCNGYIAVFPYTKLQSPDSSDISVVVSASCEDLRVNNLTVANMPTARRIRTESGSEDISCIDINPGYADLSNSCLFHYGESPVSFRTVLKRFIFSVELTATALASPGHSSFTQVAFPANMLPYGSTNAEIDMFSYLRYAYLGYRGGIRQRVHSLSKVDTKLHNMMFASLLPPGNVTVGGAISTVPVRESIDGTVAFSWGTGGGIEFEVPFYSPNLFALSFADDGVGSTSPLPWVKGYKVQIDVTETTTTNAVMISRASGEDFTFLRYQGAPYYTT